MENGTQRVSDLPSLEGLMLWTIRAWVIGHCHGRDAARGIHAVCDRLGVPEAAFAIGHFMAAIGNGARRTIEVNCVCYPDVSDDEMRLLRALALEQYEAPEDAYDTLTVMIGERYVATACASAQRLVHLLEAAGHLLRPVRPEPTNAAAKAGAVWWPSHGSTSLH
jgi:hypothetical protein